MDITEIDNELDILGYALSKATDATHRAGLVVRCDQLLDMRNHANRMTTWEAGWVSTPYPGPTKKKGRKK